MGFGCIICTEDFNSSESGCDGDKTPMCIKSCGHVFHKSCLSLWLAKSGTCPICREPTANKPSHITKLHFQRLSLDNSSILGLLDETDKLRDDIKTKDALLAAKDATIKETQSALAKFRADLTAVMNNFPTSSMLNPKDEVSSASSSASHVDSAVDPNRNRIKIVSSHSIAGRPPISSAMATAAEINPRTRILAAGASVAPRTSSRGRSASSGQLRITTLRRP